MDDRLDPLAPEAREAAKAAERRQIAEELRDGEKSAAQITRKHQPWGSLRARVRYDLAKRLV
jgi:hypothetical protein